jgi:hypothetical protein
MNKVLTQTLKALRIDGLSERVVFCSRQGTPMVHFVQHLSVLYGRQVLQVYLPRPATHICQSSGDGVCGFADCERADGT